MSTVNECVLAWEDKVWSNSTITQLCNRIYNFDVLNENSESEDGKIYFDTEISFIVYKITRGLKQEYLTGQRQYPYKCRIDLYLEVKPDTKAHEKIHEIIEAIDSVYHSELGHTWDGTITNINNGTETIDTESLVLDNRNCLKASIEYTAYKWFVE